MHMLGMSGRQLAKLGNLSEGYVRKLVKHKQIPQLADGSYDENVCLPLLNKLRDPAQSKVRTDPRTAVRTKPTVRTEEDARAAVALVRRVLAEEGVVSLEIDYFAARTADTILKAHERDLRIAERRKELVPLAKVKEHATKAFIGYRQAMQRLPSRHVPGMAAELGCDPTLLETLMAKAIHDELTELSAPVIRG